MTWGVGVWASDLGCLEGATATMGWSENMSPNVIVDSARLKLDSVRRGVGWGSSWGSELAATLCTAAAWPCKTCLHSLSLVIARSMWCNNIDCMACSVDHMSQIQRRGCDSSGLTSHNTDGKLKHNTKPDRAPDDCTQRVTILSEKAKAYLRKFRWCQQE